MLLQALLRGIQLPADTYDCTHELRLYRKVAETLNADIERNKLATFATIGECLLLYTATVTFRSHAVS